MTSTATSSARLGRIVGPALTVGAAAGLAKVLLAGSELYQASLFGTSVARDAFVVAWAVPAFLVQVLSASASSALLPAYVRVRHALGPAAAGRLAATTLAVTAAALGLLAAALAAGAPLVVAGLSDLHGADAALARRLVVLLAGCVLLRGLSAAAATTLNAEGRFALPSATPSLVAVGAVLALLVGGDRLGVEALALGTLVGMAAETLVLLLALPHAGVRLGRPDRASLGPLRGAVGQQAAVALGSALLMACVLVDKAMAGRLEPGSVSALDYGYLVVGFPLSLALTAIGTAALPRFSELVVREDWPTLRAVLRRLLLGVFVLAAPLAFGIAAVAEGLVDVLFERGSFTPEDVPRVANVVSWAALQLPFHLAGVLLARLLSAMRRNQLLAVGAAVSLALNVALNLALIPLMGVGGIALATTLVYTASFFFLAWQAGRELGRRG